MGGLLGSGTSQGGGFLVYNDMRGDRAHGFPRHRTAASLLACCLIFAGCGASAPSSFETSGPAAVATAGTPQATASASSAPSTPVSSSPTTPVLAEVDAPRGFVSKIACSGSIGAGDPVAIVETRTTSGTEVILRDYAEVTNPRTVCTFAERLVDLLDARHVVVQPCAETGADCGWAIVDIPEVRYHWYDYPRSTNSVRLLGVAPDQGAIAWTETALQDDTAVRTLYLRDATGDHLVTDLESLQLGDCGPDLVTAAGFARRGPYLSVIDQYASSNLYIVDGHDLEQRFESVDSAVWSSTTNALYFGKGRDVFRWSPEVGVTLLQRDLEWSHPTISPDGNSLAFARPNGHGGHDVYLADPAHLDQARRVAENASLPVFLNDERLWYKTEGTPGCGGEDVPPREMVYNLTTSTAASTVITAVLSVWPASR